MANGGGFNSMQIPGANQMRTVWQHQSLKFDHNGVQIEIHPEGKVTLTTAGPDPEKPGDIVTDEVTVPASVIFKAANALKMTRNQVQVPVGSNIQSASNDN